nr:hypothetical protein [uncultured Albidiferax sp.]
MSSIARVLGYAYILVTILAMCDVIDMHMCIGEPGTCSPAVTAPAKATTV